MSIPGAPALAGRMTRSSLAPRFLRPANFDAGRWAPFSSNYSLSCRAFTSCAPASRSSISLRLPYNSPQTTYTALNTSTHGRFTTLKSPSNPPCRPSSTSSKFTSHPIRENAPERPYRAKRVWPPDMSKLTPKQQFRLERKYRRRSRLKYARPVWTKWTKLAQWWAIGFVLVYCVFFLDLEQGPNPFEPVRESARSIFKDVFSSQPRDTQQKGSSEAAEASGQRPS